MAFASWTRLTDDDCSEGFVREPNLVIAGAADSDGDGLADSFDDCPAVSNIDQARAALGCIPALRPSLRSRLGAAPAPCALVDAAFR